MKELIAFLDGKEFTKIDNIEALKLVFSDVERKDTNIDIQSQDTRYFWDGKKDFGLHISSLTCGDGVWKELNDLLIKNKDFVRVLYIGTTNCGQVNFEAFSVLQFLNLSENKSIVSLNLKDCGSLEVFKTYACQNLQNIDLSTCEKLEKIDVSYCTKLATINFPNRFPKLRFFHALKTNLENDLVEMGRVFDEELRVKIAEYRKKTPGNLAGEIGYPLSENVRYDEFGNITFLDLGHLGLTEIPNHLLKIQTLEHLCLGSYYPDKVGGFVALSWVIPRYANEEHTRYRYNHFKSVELQKLSQLPNLKSLYLNSIGLDNLGFLNEIPSLISLDISGNTTLSSFDEIAKLKELKLFHASSIPAINNENIKLPKTIVSLSLVNCGLESLDFLNELPNLTECFLGGNKIETKALVNFIWNRNKINETNFRLFSEVIKSVGLQSNLIDEGFLRLFDETDDNKRKSLVSNYIENYFEENEEIQVKLIKLILIGNTRAGKTTLYDIINRNTPPKSDDKSTHGVNVFQIDEDKNDERLIIKGYDFGGQDYYHSTHWAYFSTNNTLYSLVFRSDWVDNFYVHNNDLTYPLDYWLDAIRKISKVENSTSNIADIHVQLIQNKHGELIQDLNLKSMKASFGGLKIDYYKDNEHNLKDVLNDGKSNYRENFIKNLRDKAQIRGIQRKQLAFIEFLKAKNNLGILPRQEAFAFDGKTTEWVEAALKNAHNTYDIIDFEGEENVSQFLKGYIITNISKFNDYIFYILERDKDDKTSNIEGANDTKETDNEEIAYFTEKKIKEKFTNPSNQINDELKNRLKSFLVDENYLKFVIAFMQFYKIAFKLPDDNDKYLAPAFLPEKLSKAEALFIKTFQKPIFEYRFRAFYHGNIFTEIVLEFVKELLKENNWKYLLKKNHVFMHDKNETRFLYINFGLDKEENFPILKIYNHSLNSVSDSFIEKTHKTLDRIIDFPVLPEHVESRDADELKKIEETFEKSLKDFSVEKVVYNKYEEALSFVELMCQKNINENNKDSQSIYYQSKFFRKGDYKLFLPIHKRIKYPMKKIFISYSKFDEKYKDELKSHLVTLKKRDLIETFDDRDIEAGDQFDPIIKQKIKECDIFICLISVNFLNVDYIIEQEIPLAIAESKTVLPIVIKPCDWYEMPLFKGIEDKNLKFGDINAHDKAAILTLRPEYKGKRDDQGNRQIKEFTETERDYMWLQVVETIKTFITK